MHISPLTGKADDQLKYIYVLEIDHELFAPFLTFFKASLNKNDFLKHFKTTALNPYHINLCTVLQSTF